MSWIKKHGAGLPRWLEIAAKVSAVLLLGFGAVIAYSVLVTFTLAAKGER